MKLRKQPPQTDRQEDNAIAVHGILCHSKEDKDRDRGDDGDVADVHVRPRDARAGQVDDGVPGDLAGPVVVDGVVVVRPQGAGGDNIDDGQGEGDGEEGGEDGDDHEVEAAAGALAAGLGEAVVGEGGLGCFCDLAEADVYED